jgi:hypothetical protein
MRTGILKTFFLCFFQVACITVHQNGEAECRAGRDVVTNWNWTYLQPI